MDCIEAWDGGLLKFWSRQDKARTKALRERGWGGWHTNGIIGMTRSVSARLSR